ncbi:Alpha-glucosidase [Paramicrosporidium saccamoebae]|uniref:Maltase n=1 Tax=Paramicrosporidium saccamoebae TaxID=1246581 RepID=A0A2H9TKF8_9FUNG|nr:Alpha-glucosidase [Paramicrosporidium saccamoebae]
MKFPMALTIMASMWLKVESTDWSHDRRCAVLFTERKDCGHIGTSKGECEAAGCCWRPAPSSRAGVPWCFHSQNIEPKYQMIAGIRGAGTDSYVLRHRWPESDPTSERTLEVQIEKLHDIIHLRIDGPNHPGVPSYLYRETSGYPMPLVSWDEPSYLALDIELQDDPFQFTVRRREDQSVLFSTEARSEADPFDSIIVKPHFVQLGTSLSKNHYIFGLGERASRFRRAPRRMAMNARDTPALEDQNSYGSHPFYMEMRPDGQAHGVLMLNSHPMEVELTEDALVYRMLGGAIDMYFFAGPTPDQVVEQYTRIIGRPPLMEPKFFGLHQCRYGYKTLEEWKAIVKGFEEHSIPLDGIWFDIEY